MRIISGKYKGRTIPVRKNFPSRPTTDFAKENLFNVLSNYFDFEQLSVLDLFAGTGSISYEFASRGSRVIAVEKDYRSLSFIKSTIQDLKLDTISPIKADVFKYLDHCSEEFDLVFADPPYDLRGLADLPKAVFDSAVLKENSWFILEHGKTHQFNDNQYLIDERKYGSVHFSIFKA